MGVRNWMHDKRMSEPVAGTLEVISCTANIGKVTVDRADPARLEVRWDDLPTTHDLAWRFAQQRAADLAAGVAGDTATAPQVVHRVVGDASRAVPPRAAR